MKKLIYLGLFFMTPFIYGSGDSLNVAGLSDNNTLTDDARVWWWDVIDGDTVDYNIRGDNLQPFLRTGLNLRTRSIPYNLLLGTSSQPGGLFFNVKLRVDGKSYFDDDLFLQNKLRFGDASGGYIDYSSSELSFYSPTSGLNSLADIISGGSSLSLRNGMQIIGDYGELGGNLIKNTPIYLSGYTFSIGESGGIVTSELSINPYGSVNLKAYSTNYIIGTDVDIYASGSFRLYSQSSAENIFRDYTSTPYGLCLYAWDTYWANIVNNDQDEALVPYGGLKDALSEYEDGAGGVQDQDLLDNDTLYIKLWNEDIDTFALEAVVIDTIACDLYEVTLSISSANLLAGDSLQIVAAPGSGKAIIPLGGSLFYNHNGTSYTGGDASYINEFEVGGGSSKNIYDLITSTFTAGSDYVRIIEHTMTESPTINLNSPVWINLAAFSTGDGTAILKFRYTVADFN